eukprot:2883529-Rhodomonas_salina.2
MLRQYRPRAGRYKASDLDMRPDRDRPALADLFCTAPARSVPDMAEQRLCRYRTWHSAAYACTGHERVQRMSVPDMA